MELDALDLIIEPWLTILDFKLYLVEIAGAFDTLRLKSERYDTAVLESEIERSEVIIAAAGDWHHQHVCESVAEFWGGQEVLEQP